MFKLVSLSLLASAVALSPASAQSTNKSSPNGASAVNASADSGEKKVCKRLVRSGTNARMKVCLTKAEWKKVEEDR
jgi:predicted transglutaminase-like cysteine proteinase